MRFGDKPSGVLERYRYLEAGDGLMLFTTPGDQSYASLAKRLSFASLDRWIQHTPAISTIWPNLAV